MQKIKVVIADSQYLTRSGLARLIMAQEQFELQAQLASGTDLLTEISLQPADVLILDYLSSDFRIELIQEIKKLAPQTRVLIISADLARENIFKAIELGSNSFVTKNCSEEEIISAILATSKNERFFCNRILEIFIDRPETQTQADPGANLTNREVEILKLIGKGYSTKELAALLHLSQHTIYTHRKNMMKKLGVNSSTDMILAAVNLGLIKSTRKSA